MNPHLARLICKLTGHATTGMVPPYGHETHGCSRCGRLVTFAGTGPRGKFR